MKSIYILVITIFCFTNCVGQDKVAFDIQETFIDKIDSKKLKADFIKNDSIFYEDADYIVTKTCSGEWGGSIWFKSKKNGIKYSCNATCPVAINVINGKYIITNSLAHLSGSSDIIEIENPELMAVLELPRLREKKGDTILRYIGDNESKSRQGIKKIWGDYGTMILTSFPYKEKLYHIISKDGKTFLGVIEKNKLKILNQISEEQIWDYDPKTFKDKNGNLTVFFNSDISGYIEIKENRIKVYRTK